ncbi:MAG: S8 family serine peptidase [Phycisphaerales bacterium]|nr:S8 family serine peptidase [Phycisphaerales bacterium]
MFSGGFGQVGYADDQPYVPSDPYFLPYDSGAGTGNPCFPLGQHWISTTKVDRAWWRVGYRLGLPIVLDPDDRSRLIAIINTGIEQTHPEFGVDGYGTPKIHTESTSVFDSRPGTFIGCPCNPSLLDPSQIEDIQDVWCQSGPASFNSHGTIEAGLAGATGNNATGMAGVGRQRSRASRRRGHAVLWSRMFAYGLLVRRIQRRRSHHLRSIARSCDLHRVHEHLRRMVLRRHRRRVVRGST